MDTTKKSSKGGGGGSREGAFPTSKSTGNMVGETGPGRPKLPVVEAHQRHALTLLRMEDLLVNGVSGEGTPDEGPDAVDLCHRLVEFATRLTAAKRHILEDPELYADEAEGSSSAPRGRRRKVCERLAAVPGKLDHASVVAYVVGEFPGEEENSIETSKSATHDEVKLENGGMSCSPANVVPAVISKETVEEKSIRNEIPKKMEDASAKVVSKKKESSSVKEGEGESDLGRRTNKGALPKVEEMTDAKESIEAELFETGL